MKTFIRVNEIWTDFSVFFHNMRNFTHNTFMNATVALIILQFLITMLFYPLRVGAKGHVSLARDRIEFDLSLFRFSIVRLRIRKTDGAFEVRINGKSPKGDKKASVRQVSNVLKQYKIEGIRARGNLLALIGADDAKNSAIAYAVLTSVLQPLIQNVKVYTAQPADAFEIDGRVRVKINLLQIAGLISASLKG